MTTLEAVTSLTDRPDSGGAGQWATDTLTRTLTMSLTSEDGGTYTYTASISDTGSFTGIVGAPTPNQGGQYAGQVILGPVHGNVLGSMSYTVTSDTQADMSLVPASQDGAGFSTSLWPQQAFPSGAVVTVTAGDWSWGYQADMRELPPHTVNQHWTDASANGDGQGDGDGNIRGA